MISREDEVPYDGCGSEQTCVKLGYCQQAFFLNQLIGTEDWSNVNDAAQKLTCGNPALMRLLLKNLAHLNPETVGILKSNKIIPPYA